MNTKPIATFAAMTLLLAGTVFTAPGAFAKNKNNSAMEQTVILNNLNVEQQTLLNQINTYVTAGQISPQQGASFSAELSQIASQSTMAATNPMMTQQVINQFANLSSQIQTSLQPSGTFLPQTTLPLIGGPGLYESWKNRMATERNNLEADFQNRRAIDRQNRMQYDQQAQSRALAELNERAAREQQRYAQMTAAQQQQWAQKIQRDQMLAAQNPAFQGQVQRDAMNQSRALNDLAARQSAAQAAATRKAQEVQQEYYQKIQNDQR